MRLRWNGEPGLEVTDEAQLDQALDALLAGPAADRPLIAYLTGDAGALGLGLDPAGSGALLFAPAGRQYLATGELPGCIGWEPEPGLLAG
jgi:hypothetical protein